MCVIAVECAPPTEILNGYLEISSNETVFGTTVQYSCKSGYKMIGPAIITCLANGQYDAVPPTCLGNLLLL